MMTDISITTKTELLTHMREARREFLALLSNVPEERMDDIALYDTWTIKDFIAHIGWWEQSTADRIAALRAGNHAEAPIGTDKINADILRRHHDLPLDQVRIMESLGFTALETQIEQLTEEEIFSADHFEVTEGEPLLQWIIDNTYGHYDEHQPDVIAWMQKNGLLA